MSNAISTYLKRIVLITTSFVLALGLTTAAVPFLAAETASAIDYISINSVPELRSAIESQADGQVWTIGAGEYGIDRFNGIEVEGQTGWYLPITANNLTINGVGNPTLFGQEYSANGNWSSQNLVSVFGDNVTINGLTLMPKVDPNKTIEVLGSNFTLENTTITPNTKVAASVYDNIALEADKSFAKQWGGSIYFSHEGNHTLSNVTINNAGVSFRYAPLNTHIAFNNVNIFNQTNDNFTNTYRYSSGFNNPGNTTVGAPQVTYSVNSTLNNLESALIGAQGGDTVLLASDIAVPAQITLNKKITLDGQGNTVSVNGAGYRFLVKADGTTLKNMNIVKTDKTGVQNIVGIQANDVTIDNIDFSGQYAAGDGEVSRALEISGNNFTVKDSSFKNLRQPAYVNSFTGSVSNSQVDVTKGWVLVADSNVHFVGNTWGTNATDIAIIDSDGNPSTPITNNYTCEVMAQIRADNGNAKIDNQVMTAACPPMLSVVTPSAGQYVSTKVNDNKLKITGSFTDDVKANYATFQLVRNGSVAIGTLYGYGSVYNPAATYADVDGAYVYNLAVPAILADGEYSLFFSGKDFEGGATTRMERKFVIDNVKPTTPTVTSPTARKYYSAAPIVTNWTPSNDATSGIDRYQVAYNYDDGHSFTNSTCANETISGVSVYCRDTTATTRNHNPSANEQMGVTVWVRAFDKAGNASDWSKSVHYFYDNTDPMTNIVAPVGLVGNSFAVSGDASDNLALNRVYVQLVNRENNQRYGGTTINLIPEGANAHWSKTFNASELNLPDGNYAAHVSVVDMAGNTSSAGWTANFAVDSTAPAVTIVAPTAINSGTPLTLAGTVNDPASTVQVMLNGNAYDATVSGNDWSLGLTSDDTAALLAGTTYGIAVIATDQAGNASDSTDVGANTTLAVTAPDTSNEEGIQSQPQTLTTPTPPTQPNFVPAGNAAADDLGEEDVQGAQTDKNENQLKNPAVLAGATGDGWNILGLMWYWWLLIIAAVGAAWWMIAAARRRGNES